jgi:oligopeptidase A
MQHSRRRELRERLYRAYIARASSGDFDNTPLITQILKLRQEMARLLEYQNYADLSLATKMASGVQAVATLHEKLRVASFDRAHREFQELKEFSRTHAELQIATDTETMELQHWDVSFWAERLREDRYDFSEEELRPYFPLPRVLEGLFALAERLFEVKICSADGEVPVWHEDVRFFRITGENEIPLAAFYLDPYSRPQEKRGGAWMDECTGRSRLFSDAIAGQRLPVAYLVCNQSPPVDGQPSLMRFREVETLFHEFGHGLQHMLTSVDYGFAAGINGVEHDAIELASQFMENWCYHRDTLLAMGCHYETNESLPTTFYDKICAARTFRAGEQMVRQLLFGLTDMMLHDGYDPDGDVTPFDIQRAVAETTSTLPLLADDRFLCSFSHIFAGGYAAGYYAYKWAEVLSADAFAMFEETGLEDPEAVATVGRRFRDTVLAMGGSQPAMDVFMAFRGREPDPAPLLRHSGLAD